MVGREIVFHRTHSGLEEPLRALVRDELSDAEEKLAYLFSLSKNTLDSLVKPSVIITGLDSETGFSFGERLYLDKQEKPHFLNGATYTVNVNQLTAYYVGRAVGQWFHHHVNTALRINANKTVDDLVTLIRKGKSKEAEPHIRNDGGYNRLFVLVSHYSGLYYNEHGAKRPVTSGDVSKRAEEIQPQNHKDVLEQSLLVLGKHKIREEAQGIEIAECLYATHPAEKFLRIPHLDLNEARDYIKMLTARDILE